MLDNDLLKFKVAILQIHCYFLLKKCENPLHSYFLLKNLRFLCKGFSHFPTKNKNAKDSHIFFNKNNSVFAFEVSTNVYS